MAEESTNHVQQILEGNIGWIFMGVVAGVNGAAALMQYQQGADPVAYLNAALIAAGWGFSVIINDR